MTTILFGIKDTKSNLSFTKAKVFPNQLFLLSNPLFDDKEIMIKKSCINGNLNELLNISSEKSTKKHRIFSDKDKNQSKKLKLTASTSASTFTSIKSFGKNIKKYEKNIKSKDNITYSTFLHTFINECLT